jgi:hypothetical protein
MIIFFYELYGSGRRWPTAQLIHRHRKRTQPVYSHFEHHGILLSPVTVSRRLLLLRTLRRSEESAKEKQVEVCPTMHDGVGEIGFRARNAANSRSEHAWFLHSPTLSYMLRLSNMSRVMCFSI